METARTACVDLLNTLRRDAEPTNAHLCHEDREIFARLHQKTLEDKYREVLADDELFEENKASITDQLSRMLHSWPMTKQEYASLTSYPREPQIYQNHDTAFLWKLQTRRTAAEHEAYFRDKSLQRIIEDGQFTVEKTVLKIKSISDTRTDEREKQLVIQYLIELFIADIRMQFNDYPCASMVIDQAIDILVKQLNEQLSLY
jgi:hypothetical protein